MNRLTLSLAIIGFILFELLLAVLAPAPAHAFTDISFGPAGLESLRHDRVEYLRKDGCLVTRITVENPAGGLWNLDVRPSRAEVSDKSITRAYRWGAIRCAYSVSGDRVRVSVNVNNATRNPIRELTLQLLTLSNPSAAPARLTTTKGNLEGPDLISLLYSGTTLLVANEEVTTFSGLRAQPGPGGLSIVLDTGGQAPLMSGRIAGTAAAITEYRKRSVWVGRAIPPDRSDHYAVALAFTEEGESPRTVLGDVFERVAARFPHTMRWPDRRPIGMLGLASHGRESAFNPLNPRYWILVKPSVDVNSDAGRAEFQARLLEVADKTIAILKEMNAQGVIVWDIEGQQYLQPVSYVGDPRHLAPEMQGVVDRFFKRFTDAGLRCGVTIRPQTFGVSPAGQGYQETSDDADATFKTLDDKIQYARNRWGCTLFYIDSTGDPNWPIDASILQKLAAKHPHVLLSPESKTIVDYAWTAPYSDLRNGVHQLEGPRWLYPEAFSVMNVGTERLGEGDPRWQKLVQGVRSGDILMFPAWYNAPSNQAVLQIYRQAWGPKWPGSYQ